MDFESEPMEPYLAPINPLLLPHLTFLLFSIGTFFTAWFFVYEVTSNKYTRELKKEVAVGLVAAVFTGCAILSLLTWVGIYV